jgi:hypothetical protein
MRADSNLKDYIKRTIEIQQNAHIETTANTAKNKERNWDATALTGLASVPQTPLYGLRAASAPS